MDARELVLEALATLETDQAGLAKRLGRSQATVSRWVSGDTTPDFESCLRLARIIGVPARRVVEAAGLDPLLVPDHPSDPQIPDLRPRLVSLHALLQHASDEDLNVIEDFARWKVQPTQRRAIGRQDAAAKRLKAADRKLGGRRANGEDEGSSGPLAVDFHAVTSAAAPWRTARATAMGTL